MSAKFSEIPLDRSCKIIKVHECGIWAFDKAPGVLSHPNNAKQKVNRQSRTLLSATYDESEEVYYWKNRKGKEEKMYLLHRLDSPTSGVILGATSSRVARCIKGVFAERGAYKAYHAIVIPSTKPFRNDTWKDNLVEKRVEGKIRVGRGKGTLAITKAFIEKERVGRFGLSLLKLIPQTGRTHQLRVQCALRRMPVLGDKNYGNFATNRKLAKASKLDRLFLHASNLELSVEINGKKVIFRAESPLPPAFESLIC